MTNPAGAGLPTLRVLPTADDLWAAAATEIATTLAGSIEARGVAHWSTTGGSAAPGIYRALREPPLRDAVDWSRVHVWWGDDRFVPPDHQLSNVLPLTEVLLEGGIEAVLHPIPMAGAIAHGGAAWAAARYAQELHDRGPAAGPGGDPAFDVLLLGVGPDGHILSVFPGSATWDGPGLCAAVPAPTHVEPHVERVTLHPRLVAAARRILVVTTGASKAAALGRAWTGDDVRELPVRAARVAGATWLLDAAAAAELPAR